MQGRLLQGLERSQPPVHGLLPAPVFIQLLVKQQQFRPDRLDPRLAFVPLRQ